MILRRSVLLSMVSLLLSIHAGPGLAASVPPLLNPPLGERWFIISMDDEKTGFGREETDPRPGGYEITAEGSARMQVLGFSREAASHEHYLVNRDLSLRSFEVEEMIDRIPMKAEGKVTSKGISLTVESKGEKKERFIRVNGPVYSPPTVNLYPLMRGAEAGKKYHLQMLDVEALKVKKVGISVIGIEREGNINTIHMQNDLYPVVDNDVWVDEEGNTLRESVRDGLIVTRAERGGAVRRFILEAAVAKSDVMLDFSLVRVEPPIKRQTALKAMNVELTGVPESLPLLDGADQQAERLSSGVARFRVTRPALPRDAMPGNAGEYGEFLKATEWIPAASPSIIAAASEILGSERGRNAMMTKLAHWVATNVKDEAGGSQSPLEAMKRGAGNCISRVRLFVALARAAGIPTRVVSGLAYFEGKGFLYHSWAESYMGGWIAVDPSLDQLPADATHLKLVEGDSPADMEPMAALIGHIKARVTRLEY